MKVLCPGCRSTLSIPDEKVPEGKVIRVLCPRCKNPIQVGRTSGSSEPSKEQVSPAPFADEHPPQSSSSPSSIPPSSPSSASSLPPSSPSSSPNLGFTGAGGGLGDMAALDMVEEGIEKALLYISDPSSLQMIEQALQQMDYYVSSAPTARHAVNKLINNTYDLVVSDEILQKRSEKGEEDEESEFFLEYVQSLDMYTRRQFLLCLISDKLRTLDHLSAFRFGVNLILNKQDLDKAKLIFERAIREHKGLYRAFLRELKSKE